MLSGYYIFFSGIEHGFKCINERTFVSEAQC